MRRRRDRAAGSLKRFLLKFSGKLFMISRLNPGQNGKYIILSMFCLMICIGLVAGFRFCRKGDHRGRNADAGAVGDAWTFGTDRHHAGRIETRPLSSPFATGAVGFGSPILGCSL